MLMNHFKKLGNYNGGNGTNKLKFIGHFEILFYSCPAAMGFNAKSLEPNSSIHRIVCLCMSFPCIFFFCFQDSFAFCGIRQFDCDAVGLGFSVCFVSCFLSVSHLQISVSIKSSAIAGPICFSPLPISFPSSPSAHSLS